MKAFKMLFEIFEKRTGKLTGDGDFNSAMVKLDPGGAEVIPD